MPGPASLKPGLPGPLGTLVQGFWQSIIRPYLARKPLGELAVASLLARIVGLMGNRSEAEADDSCVLLFFSLSSCHRNNRIRALFVPDFPLSLVRPLSRCGLP